MGTPINKLNGLEWTGEDLRKKFSHTYVQATCIDTPVIHNQLFWIQDPSTIEGTSFYVCGTVVYEDGSIPNIPFKILWKHFLIEEERPSPCISNIGDQQAFMFLYNPERQWKRGFCMNNSYIFYSPFCPKRGGSELKGQEAHCILKPTHSTLLKALNAFKSETTVVGRALNNRYWLFRKPEKEAISLYRHRTFMGSFLGKKFFINNSAKILEEELKMELPIIKENYASTFT